MPRPSLPELLASQFYAWELRGRGWQESSFPVGLEPPFRPFPGYFLPAPAGDDGFRPTFWSRLLAPRPAPQAPPEIEEPAPRPAAVPESLSEFRVSQPLEGLRGAQGGERLLLALSGAEEPFAFEIIGVPGRLAVQFVCGRADSGLLTSQLRAFHPEVSIEEAPGALRQAWGESPGETVVLHFGLGREFMQPLASFAAREADPLLPLFGALAELEPRETGLVQVLFAPAREEWAASVLRSVVTASGEPFFADCPELTRQAREKVARPLFAVCLRLAAQSLEQARAWRIVRDLAGGLAHFGDGAGNELVPLAEEGEEALPRLFARTTCRPGMLLASTELAALVHLPGESVRLAEFDRQARRSKAAPGLAAAEGVLLGENWHRGRVTPVHLPRDLRMRHVHLLGASGSGKSTLLTRMILEDLARGEGLAVLDPHGDLVDEVLGRFPKEREGDLILFDPADEEVSLGWNMLEARSEIEKTLLSSDLVGVFRRLSTSWGDQMNSVLANAILAFLESGTGGTLLDLRRFLVDRDFRAGFLKSVADPEVRFYWQREFPLLKGLPQGPILTRLDTFLRPKLVRRVVVEREHRLDFRGMVDGGGVLLAKLAQGAIGEENAALLGSLLVSAFHQAAVSRQDLAPGARRHFFLYLDEFHELATPSMAALLTGARKYRLGLTLAHQEMRQLEGRDRDLASAVLANAATRIVFRVGEEDAKSLERGFASFTALDLQNLSVGEAVARVERADHDFNLRTLPLESLAPGSAEARRLSLRDATRARFPRRPETERVEPEPAPSAPDERARKAPEPRASPPRVPAPLPPRKLPRVEKPPAPLGRGGPEHRYLQELVKRWGEAKGWRTTIEEPVLEGKGSVDVALEREDRRLACEISVTSTVEQEVANARKCLEAGFGEVVLLSLKAPRIAKLRKALEAKLPEAERARVHVFAPEEFFTFLAGPPAEEAPKVVGGYTVRVSYKQVAPEEQARRTRAISEVILRSIRRLKGEE